MASQKKYVCAFCARAFTRLEHKQRHERSHTNEKPFHCLHCTSAFVRRDLLQRHCRTVHNIHLSSNSFPSSKTNANIENNENELSNLNSGGSNNIKENGVNSANTSGTIDSSNGTSLGISDLSDSDNTNIHEITNNELINLLSISKKLYQALIKYDEGFNKFSEDNINEVFLIGYIDLSNNEEFPIFEKILSNLLSYLNSNLNAKNEINSFNVCLIYSVLSIGFNRSSHENLSLEFFNKAWNLLILKLIPTNNQNNLLSNKLEILNNLFILSFIYLYFNLEVFTKEINFNQDVIFNYLNDLSNTIFTTLIQQKSLNQEAANLYNNNIDLFWSIYILLSNFFANKIPLPPKFYNLFLNVELFDKKDLKTVMTGLSKSILLINSNFYKNIITCTLSNELNYLINYNKLLIFDLKNSLHNSIILINKSVINLKVNKVVFEIFKKKLIINSPPKFNDLLHYYIFIPQHKFDWNLLMISLKEFNYNYTNTNNFNFHLFIKNNQSTDLVNFSNNLFPFFNTAYNDINNNLGIVSFPLIFNSKFLNENMDLIKLNDFSVFDKQNLSFLIIEWYVTIMKILINLFTNNILSNNYILQCLLYLLNDSNLNLNLNDVNMFLELSKKLEVIFNNWLSFINHDEPNYLIEFRTNLSKVLANYFNSVFADSKSLSPSSTAKNLSVSSSSSNSSIPSLGRSRQSSIISMNQPGTNGVGVGAGSGISNNNISSFPGHPSSSFIANIANSNGTLPLLNDQVPKSSISIPNTVPQSSISPHSSVSGPSSSNFTTVPVPPPPADRNGKDYVLPPILNPLNINKGNLHPIMPNLQN